jgi:uncharacterized SAM-binding protein YcdF (DUF218 family)
MTDSVTTLFLTKLLPVSIYPLALAIELGLVGAVFALWGYRRLASVCTGVAVVGLWIVATPAFAEWALGTLERQHPPRAIADLPQADVAVVLGGAVSGPVSPRTTLDLGASSDRVLHAARLNRAGKVKRILVTGGNIPWLPGAVPEAELIRELMVEWGVPAAAIEISGASRNTYENALEIRAMREGQPFNSALLVTSAAHMPRAMAVFQRAGLPVFAATTDVEVVSPGPWTALRWLPDADALAMTTRAVKEWISFWAYRARGYL